MKAFLHMNMDATRLTPILNVSGIQQSFSWFAKLGWQNVFRISRGIEATE